MNCWEIIQEYGPVTSRTLGQGKKFEIAPSLRSRTGPLPLVEDMLLLRSPRINAGVNQDIN
jgi:hypothetical protein